MSTPAVVVVGAGAVGLSSALELSRRGVGDLRVIDADYPASGSSGLSVGIVETQHLTELNIEMRVRSMRRFDELAADHGLDIIRNGYLRLAFDAEQRDVFADSVRLQHELGVTDCRLLEPDEIRARVPDLQVDDVTAGLYGPSDGFLDGHLYCTLLTELLAARDVPILPKHRVLDARRKPGGGVALETSRGTVEADLVVNATGAWGSVVGEMLGAPVRVRPERHQAVMVELDRSLEYMMPSVMAYSPGSGREGIYLRHERDRQLVAGIHSLEPIGDSVDPDSYGRENDFSFLEKVAEGIEERFPGLGECRLGQGWAGIYPVSPDGLPQLGRGGEEGDVISVCALGGAGIMLSPVMGELVAEWILDGAPVTLPEAVNLVPSRFDEATDAPC